MARRKGRPTSVLKPGDINIPGVARDPGVRASIPALQTPRRIDPRGGALEDVAQAKRGVADETRNLAERTKRSGAVRADAIAQVGQAVTSVADATLRGGQIVANAQEMFAKSVTTLFAGFETLANMRKRKQDELAVEKWEFNRSQATLAFEQAEAENPNPNRLQGKAYLEDVDTRYAKYLDEVTKKTEEELGFPITGEARDKVTALSYRARVQAMESAANRDHERSVVQLYETAKQDAIASARQAAMDGDIGAAIARGEKIAERLNGVVTPEKYLSFKEATRAQAYEQGIRYYLNKGDIRTAEAIVSSLMGFEGQGSNEVTASVIAAAKAEGVDAALALAISYRETGGTFDPSSKTFIDPKTGKRASSASGLFHMTDATAKAYLGAANASDDPVANQAMAGAKLTADNIKGLQRALGAEPTPGEVYLAHVLGLGKAVQIIKSDPNMPLSAVLSAAEIRNSAPRLANGTVGDMRLWAQDAMQESMEAVVQAGILEGRAIPKNLAGLPLDDAARLWKDVEDTKKRLAEQQEKLSKEFIDAFVPVKPRTDRDPAAFVMKYSPVAAKAYGVADAVNADPEATLEQKIAATTRAFAVSIEEQKMLAQARGVPFSERDAKLLSIPQAKAMVNGLMEAKGPDAVRQFYALRDQTGSYFGKVYGELVDQGLPPEFQILGMLDPVQNPAQVNSVMHILGVPTETLKKDLGAASTTLDADLFNPIEDELAEFRQAWEYGPYGDAAKQQASGMIEAAKKVALNHYRLTGDAGEATRRAVALIEDNVEIVVGDNIRAVVPKETGLTETEIEAATEYMSARARIDEFDPLPIGAPEVIGEGDIGEEQRKFRAERTRNAASKFGVWTTNDTGDGLMLVVPLGDGVATTRLFNAKGEPYEIKFKDIPVLAKKGIEERTRLRNGVDRFGMPLSDNELP